MLRLCMTIHCLNAAIENNRKFCVYHRVDLLCAFASGDIIRLEVYSLHKSELTYLKYC